MSSTLCPMPVNPDVGILIQNVNASWIDDGPLTLNQLNLQIPKGKLCAIIGSVGSGKVCCFSMNVSFYIVQFTSAFIMKHFTTQTYDSTINSWKVSSRCLKHVRMSSSVITANLSNEASRKTYATVKCKYILRNIYVCISQVP